MNTGTAAPGKIILCGEYAVLEGAPAIVAAVDRHVHAMWIEGEDAPDLPLEARQARELAEKASGTVPHHLAIDASALRDGDRKLGLGSSGATAAAAAGAVFVWNGSDLDDESVRRRVFDCALRGHHAIAAQGSGVDVAASTFGRILRFSRDDDGARVEPLEWCEGLHASVIWTGSPARTSDFVAAVRAFEADDPSAFRLQIHGMTETASMFADAFGAGDAVQAIEAAARYGASMQRLGEMANVPIIDERLALVCAHAERFGGAAKPSGAGGGDVAIGLFADADAAGAFERSCEQNAMTPLRLRIGVPGVQTLRRSST